MVFRTRTLQPIAFFVCALFFFQNGLAPFYETNQIQARALNVPADSPDHLSPSPARGIERLPQIISQKPQPPMDALGAWVIWFHAEKALLFGGWVGFYALAYLTKPLGLASYFSLKARSSKTLRYLQPYQMVWRGPLYGFLQTAIALLIYYATSDVHSVFLILLGSQMALHILFGKFQAVQGEAGVVFTARRSTTYPWTSIFISLALDTTPILIWQSAGWAQMLFWSPLHAFFILMVATPTLRGDKNYIGMKLMATIGLTIAFALSFGMLDFLNFSSLGFIWAGLIVVSFLVMLATPSESLPRNGTPYKIEQIINGVIFMAALNIFWNPALMASLLLNGMDPLAAVIGAAVVTALMAFLTTRMVITLLCRLFLSARHVIAFRLLGTILSFCLVAAGIALQSTTQEEMSRYNTRQFFARDGEFRNDTKYLIRELKPFQNQLDRHFPGMPLLASDSQPIAGDFNSLFASLPLSNRPFFVTNRDNLPYPVNRRTLPILLELTNRLWQELPPEAQKEWNVEMRQRWPEVDPRHMFDFFYLLYGYEPAVFYHTVSKHDLGFVPPVILPLFQQRSSLPIIPDNEAFPIPSETLGFKWTSSPSNVMKILSGLPDTDEEKFGAFSLLFGWHVEPADNQPPLSKADWGVLIDLAELLHGKPYKPTQVEKGPEGIRFGFLDTPNPDQSNKISPAALRAELADFYQWEIQAEKEAIQALEDLGENPSLAVNASQPLPSSTRRNLQTLGISLHSDVNGLINPHDVYLLFKRYLENSARQEQELGVPLPSIGHIFVKKNFLTFTLNGQEIYIHFIAPENLHEVPFFRIDRRDGSILFLPDTKKNPSLKGEESLHLIDQGEEIPIGGTSKPLIDQIDDLDFTRGFRSLPWPTVGLSPHKKPDFEPQPVIPNLPLVLVLIIAAGAWYKHLPGERESPTGIPPFNTHIMA